jgi:aspartyl-tRNA(Asn)/glutamyl-tRNA(Gln) amidotransferase subunit C
MSDQQDFDVKYVAHLARLALTPDEEKKFQAQLGNILGYIEKLNELDVSNVEPTAHAVPLVNVTRADETRPSLPHDEAMRNAPAQLNGLFLVPKIVE